MKRILITIAAAAGLLFGSCIKDPVAGGRKNIPTTLSVSVSVKGIDTETRTRASVSPEEGEDQLSNLFLLFFEADPYNGGMFIEGVEITGPLAMNSDLAVDLGGTQLSITGAYNILAMANVSDDYLGESVNYWISQWQGKTQYQAMTEALAYTQADTAITPDAILMNGQAVKKADEFTIKLTMVRNVARFDVLNTKKANYDLVSVSLWNAYPTSSIWGEGSQDYSAAASRIRRFYGIDNSDNTDGSAESFLKDVVGGLYAFENRSAAPKTNDKETTCLIIGLKDRASTGDPTYYRVNINPDNSAQSLKRNNAYRVTINNVNGAGETTEELAYTGMGNTLDYTINNWDLDDNGLIVQDGNSIMALPTKTIRIGRDGTTGSSYSIYTFTNLQSFSPLAIKSQTYEPADGSIQSSLNGNTLNVQATPLGLGETERRGVVMLTFAGLEASVTIIQSGEADTYLKVHLPDGGLLPLASTAGVASGLIRVEASGPWSAKIYMPGFSFDSTQGLANAVTNVTSGSSLVIDNKFRIWTNTTNTEPAAREGFVVVTLDSDPENYSAVVMVSQRAAGGISISPAQSRVTFKGDGTGLADVANNSVTAFNVYPTDGDNVIPWDCKLMQSGANDDTAAFTYSKTTSGNINGNSVTVGVAGANPLDRVRSATLRIFLVGNEGKYVDILLVQQSQTIDISPNSFLPIPVIGGETGLITVTADGTQWSATMAMGTATSSDGHSLVNHKAYLTDENGMAIDQNTPYPMSQKFKVVFPKVYYPNREIPVTATVTLKLVGTEITKNFTVTQNTLTSKGVYAVNLRTGWGSIGSATGNWFDYYATNVRKIPGFSITNTPTTIPSNTTYMHVCDRNMSSGYDWSKVNTFMSSTDAITVLVGDDRGGVSAMNNGFSGRGYNFISPSGSTNGKANPAVADTRIMQLLTTKGGTSITLASISEFNCGGDNTVATVIPDTAVPVIVKTNNSNQVMMAIDPANMMIYIGEGEMFHTATSGNRSVFCDNLFYYVGNAARYGSHFTDMLIDNSAIPAPWDDVWGANKGVVK